MANTVKDFAAPDGPILLLSAKGLTTAGIAAANGIKDFSGNGNHGQAYGGVSVVQNSEMGDCFSFDGTGYIDGSTSVSPTSMTFAFLFSYYFTDTQAQSCLINFNPSNRIGGLYVERNNKKIKFYNATSSGPGNYYTNTLFEQNALYHIVAVSDAVNGLKLYVNGVLDAEYANVYLTHSTTFSYGIGNSTQTGGNKLKGKMSDIKIYPRALSAAEVKYLYNGFQPNIIVGQTIPSGAILDLSARGLTTAGIAQANGVVDRSGNMNAGTAYGGISIVNDSSLGECFSFDGSDDYIEFNKSSFMDAFSNIQGLTVAFKMKPNNVSGKDIVLFEGFYDEAITLFAIRLYQGKINYYVRRKTSDSWVTHSSSLSITQDGVYRVAVLFDWQNEKVSLYIDGTLDSTYDTNFGAGKLLNSPTFIWLGKHSKVNRCYRGLLTDVLVYPRVLTASEVQQLADASLKKIRGINMGSNLIKHIYYGSNLIYAKTDDYIYNNIPTEVSFKLHQLNSTSQRNTIEYTGNNANFASITYPNNVCDMGDWSDWINAHFTPVMLKYDGTVDYELNRDNLNYKADGITASDISNASYNGNAMLQIKKFYISVALSTEDAHEVFNVNISDTKKDSSYTCYGFIDKDGNEQDYAYYGLFHCYIDANSKLRSKAGITLSSSTTQGNYSTMLAAARNNGSGWDISNYALENAIGLVLMMIYKDVNPMFVHQDGSNNYREYDIAPYNTTGALAASGGFPWTTTSTMPKALWLESYWRNAGITTPRDSIWINGLGSLRNSNNSKGVGLYYKLTPPYTLSDPTLWTYMSNTIPYIYVSNSHQIQDVTVYENLLFPKSDGPDAIGVGTGLAAAHYNRFWGGGDINGDKPSYNSTTQIYPAKTGLYRAFDKWVAPPHYMSYHAYGNDASGAHLQIGSARLTYLKNSN